jgi:hypothetical protein
MKNMPIYQALAQAFAVEGVDTHFTLMGDGNMHWATVMCGRLDILPDHPAAFSAQAPGSESVRRPPFSTRMSECTEA